MLSVMTGTKPFSRFTKRKALCPFSTESSRIGLMKGNIFNRMSRIFQFTYSRVPTMLEFKKIKLKNNNVD